MGFEATVARFDRWAGSYDGAALQSVLFDPVHEALLDRMLRIAPAPRRILDVGCGTGRLLRAAGTRLPAAALAGVDASSRMLSVAASGEHPARFARATAAGLPFPDGAFDWVLCTFSYRHWSEPGAGLREAARVLDRGGLLGLADVFVPAQATRRVWWRRRPATPLAVLQCAARQAGLTPLPATRINGFGLLGEATLVLARRHR